MKARLLVSFAVVLLLGSFGSAQNKEVSPTTAAELKQLCKSYQLIQLDIELNKRMGSDEVTRAAGCVNYINGVISTVLVMDVGYFPGLRVEWADLNKKISYAEMVKTFMDFINAHPETEKDSAAGTVVVSLMHAHLVIPKHWEEKHKGS
jgi:Rap1a immunity proteins